MRFHSQIGALFSRVGSEKMVATPGRGVTRDSRPFGFRGVLAGFALGMALLGGVSEARADLTSGGGGGELSEWDSLDLLLAAEPRREDFNTQADYEIAYFRWLYVVLGGDPRDLDPMAPEEPGEGGN